MGTLLKKTGAKKTGMPRKKRMRLALVPLPLDVPDNQLGLIDDDLVPTKRPLLSPSPPSPPPPPLPFAEVCFHHHSGLTGVNCFRSHSSGVLHKGTIGFDPHPLTPVTRVCSSSPPLPLHEKSRAILHCHRSCRFSPRPHRLLLRQQSSMPLQKWLHWSVTLIDRSA